MAISKIMFCDERGQGPPSLYFSLVSLKKFNKYGIFQPKKGAKICNYVILSQIPHIGPNY